MFGGVAFIITIFFTKYKFLKYWEPGLLQPAMINPSFWIRIKGSYCHSILDLLCQKSILIFWRKKASTFFTLCIQLFKYNNFYKYDCFEITGPNQFYNCFAGTGSTVVLRDHHSSVVQIVAFVLKLLDRYRILRTRTPSLFGKLRVKR